MTRFARSKGSKASNERLPEDATSWAEMQQQLAAKKLEAENRKHRKEAEAVRMRNYEKFLEETEAKRTAEIQWADFPLAAVPEQKNNKLKDVSKKRKLEEKQDVVASNKKDKVMKNINAISNKDDINKNKSSKKSVEDNKTKKSKKHKKDNIKEANKSEDCEEPEERKNNKKSKQKQFNPVYLNGDEKKLVLFEKCTLFKEDAERLRELRKVMQSKGLPKSEIENAIKRERRKAEKAYKTAKHQICFNCRQSGHSLSDCPSLKNDESARITSGICFKCGSTEHSHLKCKVVKSQEYKFATCFICNEQGHISKQCPDNARGLYPKGGCCNLCGDVTHLKKDCPKYIAEQESRTINLDRIWNDDIEGLGGEDKKVIVKPKIVHKVVKF